MAMRPIMYESQELNAQRLELTDKDGHYFLGPNLTLRNCTVTLSPSPGWIHIRSAKFIDCTFEVKRDLKSFQGWIYSSLSGCRFKGRMPGCDFGHWPEYEEGARDGWIENCDFSEARLDGCRFHRCDIQTLKLPRWPCFTFLEPFKRHHELSSVKWPELFDSIIIQPMLKKHPPSMVALSYHAPRIAKDMETTPEELKAVIDTLDCIAC